MFLKENDERICYFKMTKLNTRNSVAYKFRFEYVSLQFVTVIQLFIMRRPFDVYFRFHVILFMTGNCFMCRTIECRKNPVEKKTAEKVTI